MTNLEWIKTLTPKQFANWLYGFWWKEQNKFTSSRDGLEWWLQQEKQEQDNEWIPVSKRLPESNDIVLVTLNDSHVAEASYFNQHWVYYAGEAFESNYPVAWMPLPEPYGKEKE